jgi:hypothetical protein
LGPKAADQDRKVQLRTLHSQIKSLPLEVKEYARYNFLVDIDLKLKELQTHQCETTDKLEKILRSKLIGEGSNPNKFRIGGHERGLYEKFFRIEPQKFMSKPQFLTGL